MSPRPSEPIELKPCPFCGDKDIDVSRGVTGAPFLFFKCRQCGATVSFDNMAANHFPGLAIANWNSRSKESEE